MTLSYREKMIAVVSNGVSIFSLLQEREELPQDVTMYDFVLKIIPKDLKKGVTAELIDEIFQYVTSAHGS